MPANGNALIGLDWANYGALPYAINLFKQCFSQQAPAAPASFAWTQQLDQYGFPNVSLPTYRIDNYFQSWQTVNGYAGRYALKWTGKAGQVTLSIGATALYNISVTSGSITRAGGDINFYGTDGYVEFDASGTGNGVIHFETSGGTWDGTCRNMTLFRLDDAADQTAGKLVRQEFIDKIKATGVRAIRTMDMNAVNNGCQALWKYRRKVTDFDWFGSVRIPAGIFAGTASGTNDYVSSLAPDNSASLTDGEATAVMVQNQQANATQATFKEGTKAQKNCRYIGGSLMNNGTGGAYDTIKANINIFQYNSMLDGYIWLATNFQSGFGMTESLPYEVCAEMAIRAGVDLYMCIPTLYTPSSIQSLGALMGGLFAGTGLTCFIELGNELWNGQFGQAQLMSSIATTLGFTAAAPANGDVNLARFSTQGLFHRIAMEAFATGWTGAGASMNYLKRVLAVQNFGSLAALDLYCFKGTQLGAYGYATAGNRPIDYTDIVAAAPYIWGGTMLADYHWNSSNLNSTMLTNVCAAADAYAGGGAGLATGIAYVDGQLRAGVAIGGGVDTNSLSYCIPTQMKLWDDLIKTYNVSRTSPLRLGCYEGGTQVLWPNTGQCTALGISTTYSDKIKNMVLGWRASSVASTFMQDYYAALMALPNMALPGQYTHIAGTGSNWMNQDGFYTPDSGQTTGLKAANAKAKRLMRLNGA